jgi:hypothetical protein
MDPFTLAAIGIGALIVAKNKKTPTGEVVARAPVDNTKVQTTAPKLTAGSQTPPVEATDLPTLDTRELQRTLYPAGIWNPAAPMTQGSGTDIADSGATYGRPAAVQEIAPINVGNNLTLAGVQSEQLTGIRVSPLNPLMSQVYGADGRTVLEIPTSDADQYRAQLGIS